MKIQALFTVLPIALLVGCAQTPGRGTMAMVGPSQNAGIVELDAKALAIGVAPMLPSGAAPIGQIEGRSCKNSLLDPAPTKDAALAQVKQKAANLGAKGIFDVKYGTDANPTAMNCWATIRATATAYR